jgi:hypothetical protein
MSRVITRWDLLIGSVLKQAEAGDYRQLLSSLRSGNPPPEICALAADIIEGKIKRPKHRPLRYRTVHEMTLQAQRVLELQANGWPKRMAAVKKAAEEFGVGTRTIQESLAVCEPALKATKQAIRVLEARLRKKVAT